MKTVHVIWVIGLALLLLGCKKEKPVKYGFTITDSCKSALVVVADMPEQAKQSVYKTMVGLRDPSVDMVLWVTQNPSLLPQKDTIDPRITYNFAPSVDSAIALARQRFTTGDWEKVSARMIILQESLSDTAMREWRKKLSKENVALYTLR